MLMIRQFEMRAEGAYQKGKIGGFFHSYIGQEAIQVGAVEAVGVDKNWWLTTYRCHALALLCGATCNEIMAELYGKANGNAQGRGGSMHLYADRMLGGFGIVGGHVPLATGAAFSLKYQQQTGVAICFLGEGAFVQGAVHEALNLAALWNLPCIYVIENNQWGMGTAVDRAVCQQPIAESFGPGYGIPAYTLDGMDVIASYQGFSAIYEKVKETSRPALVEVITERFKGHSISDPGLYRSKEALGEIKTNDPIHRFTQYLLDAKVCTQSDIDLMEEEIKQEVLASIEFAENGPEPSVATLEEGVFAE